MIEEKGVQDGLFGDACFLTFRMLEIEATLWKTSE